MCVKLQLSVDRDMEVLCVTQVLTLGTKIKTNYPIFYIH